jgi:hypothetical protein
MTSFNKDNRGRYFRDVLYGKIYPEDYLWETEFDEDF